MTGQAPAGIDVNTANIARIYDYFLDGKDNFAADREAAGKIIAMMPQVPLVAQENRAFLRRAVRFLAGDLGIRQFIDLGAGLPTQGNVHDIARQVVPDARVLYVDNDPVVCCHGRALLADEATQILGADLRHPEDIIDDPATRELIDFSEPFALLLTAVLHFVPDEADPAGIIARFRDVMPPGSCLVISHGTLESAPNDLRPKLSRAVYRQASAALTLRPPEAVRGFFDGFDLVEPGLVWISEWRPDPLDGDGEFIETMRGGVGRRLC